MKSVATKVSKSMPPKTPVPMERRAPAPAPTANTNGTTPSTKAMEVITSGRKRTRAASTAASAAERPASRAFTANSTMRMAFFAANPMSVTSPIWKYRSFGVPRTQIATNAPRSANGTVRITPNGSDHFS